MADDETTTTAPAPEAEAAPPAAGAASEAAAAAPPPGAAEQQRQQPQQQPDPEPEQEAEPAPPAVPTAAAAVSAVVDEARAKAAAAEHPAAAAAAAVCVPCQVPPRRFTPDGKVTSVDLTPDGAYVIVGCSDGTIRLYSMAEPGWGCEGLILGQIHAKGLITNLIFHVEVTDDGRFAFAGVLRGSVEMFAYDLTRLPAGQWGADGTPTPPPRRLSRAQADALIRCHTNLDPKLRGFGAVARVDREGAGTAPEYRLVCGLGIKNLHVWRFHEGARPGPGAGPQEPLWECLYDLVSSGMSIELLAVRPGGLEVVSKACGQNLRVWDLANATEATKCPYLDVLNTHDTRAVFGSFAFGGDAQLSLVRLDLCRQLNRMELPLPSSSSSTAAASQQRSKRRALCSVKDVVGTHGSTGARGDAGSPVLVICSDGGVHCYEDGGAASATGRLVPVRSLTVEEDDDVAFTLAAVGAGRTPVVLQTRWNTQENAGEILVEPLRLGEGGKQAAVALRRKALAEVEEAGAVGSAGGGGKRHSTGVAVARCGGKQQQQDKENAAPLTGAAAAAGGADTGGEEGGAEAPTGGGKKGGGKRRAKSSPALLVVPPLVLEEGGGGPGRKSQSAPPTASPREVQQGGRPTPRGASAGRAAAAAAEALPDGLMACKPQPAPWRGAGGAGAVLPRGQEQAPYNPGKRKHFDPFAAALSAKSSFHAGLSGNSGSHKRGKPLSYLALSVAAGAASGDGVPRAMRDVEARRVAEDGAGKTADFFKERVARQEAHRALRAGMAAERNRLVGASPSSTTSNQQEQQQQPQSVVRSWAELRAKHQRERAALARKFREEHDWVRERFLEAVERERLTFHVNKHALPSQVRDPLGFLWWHNARLPLKKQWGRFRAFPQQTAEVLALQGLPDIGARRFSLTAVVSNYRDLAARTVRRQQAEADALAGVQGMELPFAHVRPVKVEYPYSGDWAVQDPVAAEAAAKAKAEAGARAAVGVVGQGQGEGGERDGDDVLVPAEVVVEGVDAPVVAVLPVAVAVAVPPPNAEGEMGGEEDKRPDSPTASVTEGEQAPVVGEGQEEARRASTASFDPMAVEAEEGKTSVSPVPQQQKEAMPARPVFGGGEGEGEEGKEMDVSA